MTFYRIILVILSLYATNIGGFRFDYVFNERADGWLKYHRVPATWSNAKNRCHAEGAILASPLSNKRREAILKYLSSEPAQAIFTGVHASYSDREFASIEGVPLARLPITWTAGEPKDFSKSCLAMMTKNNGTISDIKCSDTLPYVCHKKLTQLPLTECGTYDTEYKLDVTTENCYKFHRRGLDWDGAVMTCAAEGGHLAIINSDQEASVLNEILNNYKKLKIFAPNNGGIFLGVRDLRDGGSWMTIHGQTLSQAGFDKWSNGEPNNSTTESPDGEACVVFTRSVLNDFWCGYTFPFICEMKPNSLQEFSLD